MRLALGIPGVNISQFTSGQGGTFFGTNGYFGLSGLMRAKAMVKTFRQDKLLIRRDRPSEYAASRFGIVWLSIRCPSQRQVDAMEFAAILRQELDRVGPNSGTRRRAFQRVSARLQTANAAHRELPDK
jgi:hypothetical protein